MIGTILEKIGQFIRGSLGLIILIVVLLGGGYFLLFTSTDNPPTEIIELTLRAMSGGINIYVPTIEANLTRTPEIISLTEAAPTISLEGRKETRQFAASAWSDNEHATRGQTAIQAAGPPNTDICGDSLTAFLPGEEALTAELRVFFAQLVTPTGVIISETFNPGGVIRVEALDVLGQRHTIYEAQASSRGICPFSTIAVIQGADYQTNTLIITIQKIDGSLWTEIDSVELIGINYN